MQSLKITPRSIAITALVFGLATGFFVFFHQHGNDLQSADASTTDDCIHVADEIKANSLLTRMFPNAKILSKEPLSLGDTKSCLLEVELLADASVSSSRGFVYVLPDGERFLNGPLMDKRSQIATQGADNQLSVEIVAALAEQQKAIESLLSPVASDKTLSNESTSATGYTNQISSSYPKALDPSELPTPEQLRETLLSKLQALPFIKTGAGPKAVYVMYDPLCPHCKRLYSDSVDLSAMHGIEFRWIPMFLNEGGWAMSAYLLKTLEQKPNEATALLDSMMRGTWKTDSLSEIINDLSENDFAAAKVSTGIFAELAKSNNRIGTPLVVFKTNDGGIDVISGLPNPEDWKSL